MLSDKPYPGWMVHAGVFFCAMVIIGSSTYIYGLFAVPLTEEFDISRANFNNGFIALLVGSGLLSPLVGRLLDKLSARLVIFSGGIMFSFGLATITYTDSKLIMLLAILGPVAYGFAACGPLGANTVVVRWFKRRRGVALGILAVATSAGGFIFAPFTAMMIENFSWRSALLINAGIAVVACALATLFLIRSHPLGAEPGYNLEFDIVDKDSSDSVPKKIQEEKIWSYGQLIRNLNFWLLTLAIGLLLASDMALITSYVPYFLGIGIELPAAAFIVSCMTASAIFGKLLVGYLADKIDLRYLFYGVALAHLGLLGVFLLQPDYWVLLFFSTLFGLAIGGVFPVWTTLLAWLFGTKNYGTVLGLTTMLTKVLSIMGVRFIGEVYDATGTYIYAFIVFMVLVSIAILLASMLRPQSINETVCDE